MSQSYKFVIFGTTTLEVAELLTSMSQTLAGSAVSHGDVAGSRVSRFSGTGEVESGTQQEFTVYGASIESDFRGILTLLVKNADGVIGLIPADSAGVAEGRKVLASLHRALEFRRNEEQDLPFVIQYHCPSETVSPSAEELDGLLGINPQVVTRCFSRAGGDEAIKGLITLFEHLQRLKSSPK